ncbi:MAG TPA: XdhC family protein [Gemmatimonadaceae bacterium]|nr:XdhC family protein [Gemmatimonadaceae bacterium]
MKQWLETRQVLDRLAELEREGKRAALATVVRVRGSAYRHEGAKMVVAEDGSTVGNVSGGCLEADVREVALQVLRTGLSQRKEYCAGIDEIAAWDLGVGCEGSVEVFVCVETASAAPERMRWRALLDGDASFAVSTDLATGVRSILTRQGDTPDAPSIRNIKGREVFVDAFTPPPQLVIAGAGDDARHLARLALDVGFRVVVVDRRPGLLTQERFPGAALVEGDGTSLGSRLLLTPDSYAVVMNHNYADDREFLRALLDTPAEYVGMLGPRQRTERIIREISATETVDEARVFGPVGLDIGTDGAEQVALAVIAEVLAVRSGRSPASLRERRAPIHAEVE